MDVLVLLLIMTGCWHGKRRGLADQVAALITLAVGFGTACSVARLAPIASLFERLIGLEPVPATVLAWAAIYFSVCLGLTLFLRSYHETLEEQELAWLDSSLGGLLGGLKVFTVCTAVTLVAAGVSDRARAAILTTHSGQAMALALSVVDGALPPKLADRLAPMLSGLEPPTPLPEEDHRPAPAPAPAPSKPPVRSQNAPPVNTTAPTKAPIRLPAPTPRAPASASDPATTHWPPARWPASTKTGEPSSGNH